MLFNDRRGSALLPFDEFVLVAALGVPFTYLVHEYGVALLQGWRFVQLVAAAPVP
jgi:hypothetical protein